MLYATYFQRAISGRVAIPSGIRADYKIINYCIYSVPGVLVSAFVMLIMIVKLQKYDDSVYFRIYRSLLSYFAKLCTCCYDVVPFQQLYCYH